VILIVLSISKTTEGIVGILIVLLTELKSPGIWSMKAIAALDL
jgi:hypothetical protein